MEANIETAQSLFKQNKYQETIDTCNQILTTDSNSIEAIKLIAKSFLAIRKIDDAHLYLNKALNINPDDYEVIKDIGNIYQAIGDLNNAKKYYKKALNINTNYAPALTNLGSIELNTDNKQAALSLLIKATESDPKLAPAWVNLTNGYVQCGKTEEAEIACHKSIELNPNLFNSHFLLGTILVGQKKLKEAEQPLRKAIALNPNLFNSHFLLGTILVRQKKLKEAEQPLRKAIELNPNLAEAHSNLGVVLKDIGNLQEAEISYRKAIELNPNLAEAHFNLGNILIDLGKLQEAESSTRKAIEVNPDFANSYNLLATILNNLQNKNESIKYKKKYLTLKAKNIKTKSNISNAIDLWSKKIIQQDNIPTFFDKAVENHIVNRNSNDIDYSYVFESLIKSKDNRFIIYEERKTTTQNKRQINGLPFVISQGTHSLIKWREYDLYKTANDLVIYSMLLNELRPEIIIELGSGNGGSAVWMADICKSLGLDFHIFSYDIKKPNFKYNDITFIEFDINTLDDDEGFPLLHSLNNKRILVIEDAHVNVLSVLYTVNKFLTSGDYLIVEDSTEKQKHIEEFIKKEPRRFMLDQYYLDFFGTNMTCSFDSIFKVF